MQNLFSSLEKRFKQCQCKILWLLVSALIFYPVPGCLPAIPDVVPVGLSQEQIKQLEREIAPLNLHQDPAHTASTLAYFQYYGIHFEGTPHHWGFFKSGKNLIAAHIFLPEAARGTVFLLHGYFDHTGTFNNLIRICLNRHFAVAAFDLPGHGLSTGERSSIKDFNDYVMVLDDFIQLCQYRLPQPYHLIGHSTGAAIAYEYLYDSRNRNPLFQKAIFLAPLVRHAFWTSSRISYVLAKPFVKDLPRKFYKNSSDPVFLERVQRDPLQGNRIPIVWLDALYTWNRRVQHYEILSTPPLLVIQGTRDGVVDWQYNIEFLQQKFDTIHIKWIKDAKHQLLNEIPPLQSEVLKSITTFLEK
jgi:alpha-beta hydrolase superfamily lysophospholipase